MNEDIKNYWQDHNDLRQRLSSIIYKKPSSLESYSKDIGISAPSLASFLKGKKRVDFCSWCKIQYFVNCNSTNRKIPEL